MEASATPARCPSCEAEGFTGRCPACGGELVEWSEAAALFEQHRIDRALLAELAERGGPGHTCACSRRMRRFELRGLWIDQCEACGSVWFDRGERGWLAEGHLRGEPPPPPATQARRPSPTQVPPGSPPPDARVGDVMRAQDRRRLVRVWRDLPPPRRNVIGDVPVLLGLLVVFAFFGFVFTELIWPVVLAGLLGGLLCLLALLSWVVWRFGGRGEGLLHPSTRTLVLVDRAGTVEAILELDAQAEGVLVSLRGNREEVRGEDPTRVSLIHQGTERFLTTTGSRAEALELLDHLGVPVGTGGRR